MGRAHGKKVQVVRRMSTKTRARSVLERLDPQYADLRCGLRFSNPLELLVATILSAQCTDERVNLTTPGLFARYRTPDDYADSDPADIERMIQSCGFFRNKTKNIQGAARAIRERFNGSVPGTMAELLTLPGVARKTANVVLSHAFDRNEGIAVDTHVQRVSRRLGLTEQRDPNKIEKDLMSLVPRRQWGRMSDVLIWHGRKVCHARSPKCDECVLNDICPSAPLFPASPSTSAPRSADA
jgi:endonuclease-3